MKHPLYYIQNYRVTIRFKLNMCGIQRLKLKFEDKIEDYLD